MPRLNGTGSERHGPADRTRQGENVPTPGVSVPVSVLVLVLALAEVPAVAWGLVVARAEAVPAGLTPWRRLA